MENQPPLQHAHVAERSELDMKEKGSDTSSHGERETQHNESIDPVTGQKLVDMPDDKVELTEEDCYDELGFGFSESKKWLILTVWFQSDCKIHDVSV
jgi:hypothetical protein